MLANLDEPYIGLTLENYNHLSFILIFTSIPSIKIVKLQEPKAQKLSLTCSSFNLHCLTNCLSQTWYSIRIIGVNDTQWDISSVQFAHSVMSDSLQPHESQHARPPFPSQTPGVYSNSCPSSRWCHPAISSSVVPLSSCPQSLPASRSCPMSQLFAWGGQSIGVSASASVLPMNPRTDLLQDGLVGSPYSPRDSQESSPIGIC